MSARRHWSDAEQALRTLRRRPSDRRILLMLARLPLATVFILDRLWDLHGGTVTYRSLARLRDTGLVGAIRPPLDVGCSPQRFFLTDLGLATLALDYRLDLYELVRRFHLRGSDLLRLLPALPQLAAAYELLGALAASGAVQPTLLAWHRPWHHHFQPLRAKTPVSLTLPAYAAFSWNGAAGSFLLLPDLGQVPLRTYRPTLSQLFALQRLGGVPTLLIATPTRSRASAWRELVEDVRQVHMDCLLPAYITRWEELPTGDEELLAGIGRVPAARLTQSYALPRLHVRRSSSALPSLVGDALAASPGAGAGYDLSRAALSITPARRILLDLVGKHPFLTVDRLAAVLDWRRTVARDHCDRLISHGLIRLVGKDEVGERAALGLMELTAAGMKLLAAGQGLSLTRAIVCHGLTGGGPQESIGARQSLLANLAHTLGTDALFVGLYRVAHLLTECGTDDAVLEWQNATACSRHHLRPDGYGLYRRDGRMYDFYLEYDRATMSTRGYEHKLHAYYAYWRALQLYRNGDHFPMVLVITVRDTAEEHIARVAREAAREAYVPLPLLLTCQWRVDEFINRPGLLGPIWRDPDADIDNRRYWLPVVRPDPKSV